jgi:hypothetical protein
VHRNECSVFVFCRLDVATRDLDLPIRLIRLHIGKAAADLEWPLACAMRARIRLNPQLVSGLFSSTLGCEAADRTLAVAQ